MRNKTTVLAVLMLVLTVLLSGCYNARYERNSYDYGYRSSSYGSGAMYPQAPSYGYTSQDEGQSRTDRRTNRNYSDIGRDYNRSYREAIATDHYARRSELRTRRMESEHEARRVRDMMSIPQNISRGSYNTLRDLKRIEDLFRRRR